MIRKQHSGTELITCLPSAHTFKTPETLYITRYYQIVPIILTEILIFTKHEQWLTSQQSKLYVSQIWNVDIEINHPLTHTVETRLLLFRIIKYIACIKEIKLYLLICSMTWLNLHIAIYTVLVGINCESIWTCMNLHEPACLHEPAWTCMNLFLN